MNKDQATLKEKLREKELKRRVYTKKDKDCFWSDDPECPRPDYFGQRIYDRVDHGIKITGIVLTNISRLIVRSFTKKP